MSMLRRTGLVIAVHDRLARHPEVRLLAVLDRESIVAAAKFLICHKDTVLLEGQGPVDAFSANIINLAQNSTAYAVVLTPRPRLAEIG